MNDWRMLVLGLITFYAPILLLTTAVILFGIKPRDLDSRSVASFAWSILLLWVLAALAAASLIHDGRLDQYGQYLWPPPLPQFAADAGLGALTGLALYAADSRLVPPLLTWILAQRPFLYLFLREESAAKGMSVLTLYASPWMIPVTLVTGLAEEFLWRVFYITEFQSASQSLALAMVLSSAVYGSYHYARGNRDTLMHGMNGVVLAALFLVTGNLVTSYMAHLCFNLISIYRLRVVVKSLQRRQVGRRIAQNPY